MTNTNTHNKASVAVRMIAFLIDHLILSFFSVLIFFIIVKIEQINLLTADYEKLESIIYLTIALVFLLYVIKDFINGMSIGRRIMRITVCDSNNYQSVPSKWRLLLRNILLLAWPIELFLLITSEERRRLGDRLAKSDIIMVSNKSKGI